MRIATYELGGSGPLLLLVHATGFHGMVWAPLAARLARHFRCVSLDLRGHGRSDKDPSGRYAWERFTLDIRASVDALGDVTPYALGHSCGGASVLLTEQAWPGTFRALYCYEPVVMPPRTGIDLPNALAEGARRRRAAFGSREEALERFRSKPPVADFDPAAARAYVEHGFEDVSDGTVALRCRAEDEARMYEEASRHGAWAALGSIGIPATLACGGPGAHFDEAATRAVAARIPGARTEVFGQLGHFGPLEQPDVVAHAVIAAFGS